MTNSNMTIAEMERAKDRSFGYVYNFDTKETRKLPYRSIDEVAPAGSINSSANDMAKWVQFVLAGGTAADGKRLISEASYAEWLKPQMKVNPTGTVNYALGWFVQKWNDHTVVQHGGNIDGFNALVAMVPEKKLGFVMLTNVTGSSLGSELMPIVWENILGSSKPAEAAKLPVNSLQPLAGKYHLAAAKVDIEVAVEGDSLVMTVPGQPRYTLESTGPRQFRIAGGPDGFAVKFTPEQGDAAEMYLAQPQGNFTLTRVGASVPETKTSEAVKELIGRYQSEVSGKYAEVKEADGKVSLIIPGQQPYALGEKAKDHYSLSPLPDAYSLKVVRDAAGKVEKIVIVQPEGEFGFKPVAADAKPAITVDELMAKAVEAAGGEANWRKLNSRVATFEVDLENQGVKGHGTIYTKAPNMSATETTLTALGKKIAAGFEYFDGTAGEEAYSFAPAEKFTGKRLEDARLGADFYGILNWKTNYPKAEVLPATKCGDEMCYPVTFEPEKGTRFTEFHSTATFLLVKREGVTASSTSSVMIPYTVTYSDYREVDGVKIPFQTVNSSVGSGRVVTVIKEVKHNPAIEDSVFRPRKL